MEDGEYRATFGTVWPLIVPPLLLEMIAIYCLLQPSQRKGIGFAIVFMLGFAVMIAFGVWSWCTEELVLTTDELVYRRLGRTWRLRWREIHSVVAKVEPGQNTISYLIRVETANGPKAFSTIFLPLNGPALTAEIRRRRAIALGQVAEV